MAFRDRIKKALRKASPSSSLSKSDSKTEKGTERWPSNVYKPGEAMPRAKYRAPVKKEHKEKLDSFSFADAWRRRSFVSEYSPMGTRMPSRRASLISRKSFGARSGLSRRNSIAGTRSGRESFEGADKPRHAALATTLSAEIENEGDDDVTNVGLSRVQSRDDSKPRRPAYSRRQTGELRSRAPAVAATPAPTAASGVSSAPTAVSGTSSAPSPRHYTPKAQTPKFAHDHQPFTEEDLVMALQRSHLEIPAH